MNLKTIEQIKKYSERLTFLDDKIVELEIYAEEISIGNTMIEFYMSYKDKNVKEEYNDNPEQQGWGGGFLSLLENNNYSSSRTDYKDFSINLNETVGLQVIKFLHDGLSRERQRIIKNLEKLGVTTK